MSKADSESAKNINSIYGDDTLNIHSNITPPPVPLPSSILSTGGLGGLGGGFGGLGGGGLTRGNALSLGRHQN